MTIDTDELLEFQNLIDAMVQEKKISYMDAIMEYIEQNNMEVELVAEMITPQIKSKIQIEAEDLFLIKKSKTNKIPFEND